MKSGDKIKRRNPNEPMWIETCKSYDIDPNGTFELVVFSAGRCTFKETGVAYSLPYITEKFELVSAFSKIPALLEKAKSLVGKRVSSPKSPVITVKKYGISIEGDNVYVSTLCTDYRKKHGFVVFVHDTVCSFPVDDVVEEIPPVIVSGAEVTKTHVTLKSGDVLPISFLRKVIKASETFN